MEFYTFGEFPGYSKDELNLMAIWFNVIMNIKTLPKYKNIPLTLRAPISNKRVCFFHTPKHHTDIHFGVESLCLT